MKYLLSNARTTKDVVTYIKDCIYLNLTLLKNEVPYFEGGTKEFVEEIEQSKVEEVLRDIIIDMLNRIKTLVSGVNLELTSITFNINVVDVQISINNIPVTYELKRNYKG